MYNIFSLSNLGPAAQLAARPFVFAFLVSLAMVPLARRLAHRFGFVDQPRADRWHRRPIARFGGAAIGVSVIAGLFVFGGFTEIPVPLSCAAVIFAMGLTDDAVSLRPSTKLVIEIAVASVFLYFRYRLNWTHSLTLDTLLTLVWVVGMTNAFNLLDNMDGLCAGLALIVGGALLFDLASPSPGGDAFYQLQYLALLLGAAAGFLVYNFHPASIFMGDSGSLLLGVSLAAMTLRHGDQVAAKSNPLSIIVAPVLVLLIPIFDTALVTVSRILSGRSPSDGGRDHSSHRLVAIGLSERAAVALLWLLAAVGGTLGIAIGYFQPSWTGLMASLFFLAMIIFAVYLAGVRVYERADPDTLDRSQLTPLVADFMYKRRVAEVVLDLCLITIAYYGAYRLRFEGPDFNVNFTAFYRSLPLVVAAQLIALFGVGIYRGVWRYFGMADAIVVVKGVLLGTVAAQLAILYALRFEGYSRTVFAIDAILLAILLTASRGSFRLIGEALQRNRNAATRVIVYGAGDGGALVVRELVKTQDAQHRVLGFVDDDPRKQRMRMHGYPVLGGYDSLASLVSSGVVDAVVISARIIDLDRLTDLEALCAEHGVSLSRLHVGLEPLNAIPPASATDDEHAISPARQNAS